MILPLYDCYKSQLKFTEGDGTCLTDIGEILACFEMEKIQKIRQLEKAVIESTKESNSILTFQNIIRDKNETKEVKVAAVHAMRYANYTCLILITLLLLQIVVIFIPGVYSLTSSMMDFNRFSNSPLTPAPA